MTLVQVVDTLTQRALAHADSVSRALDAKYLDLLQRTNAQLGLGWTHVGAVFTILATLIALLSIVAIAAIWYQGADYRSKLQEILDSYSAFFEKERKRHNAVMDEMVAEKKAESARIGAQLQALLESVKNAPDPKRQLSERRSLSWRNSKPSFCRMQRRCRTAWTSLTHHSRATSPGNEASSSRY